MLVSKRRGILTVSHAVYDILDKISQGKINPEQLLKLDSGMAISLLQEFDTSRLNDDTPNFNMLLSNVDDVDLNNAEHIQQLEYLYAAGISKHITEKGVSCVSCVRYVYCR